MKYNAFISYSHSQDSDLAPHLETALEKFAKPLFKQRALHIFRDANDLSASPDLWGKIEEGLKNSEYFIFLASPKAALSKWCKKEVDYWKANKSMSNFLIVMTDGELSWDESTSDFDWSKTTAIPDNLSGGFVNEPLFVDFRNHKNEESGLEYPDFRAKTVLLAATIHGKTVGNMIGENVKQHKKTLRIRNSAITILSALLIAVGTAGFYANEQRKKAEKQTKIAEEQTIEAKRQKKEALHHANRALAKSYLSDSKANVSIDPTLSVKLAAMAYNFAKSDSMNLEAYEDQLITSFNNASHFYVSHDGFEIEKDTSFIHPIRHELDDVKLNYAESEFGEYTLTIEKAGDSRTINRSYPPPSNYSFSKNGKLFIERINRFPNGTYRELNIIHVYDLNGKLISEVSTNHPNTPFIRFNDEGNRFLISAFGTRGTFLIEYNDEASKSYESIELNDKSNVTAFQISQDGSKVAIGYSDGDIELIKMYDGIFYIKYRWKLNGHKSETVNALKFSSDGKFLFSTSDSYSRKWITNTNLPYIQMKEYPTHYNTQFGVGVTRFDEGHIHFTSQFDALDFHSLIDNDVKEVFASFNNAKNYIEKNTSANNRYYATRNGLFNSKAERLITYNFPVDPERREISVTAFSDDTNYLFATRNIYLLNPDLIFERFNDTTKFGKIDSFTEEEREQFMVPDDY